MLLATVLSLGSVVALVFTRAADQSATRGSSPHPATTTASDLTTTRKG